MDVDDLLNRAIATYSNAEPPAGLDHRVLLRVREKSNRRSYWVWATAAAAVAMAVAMIVQPFASRPVAHTPPPAEPKAVVPVRPQPVIAPPPPVVAKIKRSNPRVNHEELALVRYLNTDPEGAAKAFAELQTAANRDLKIDPLAIKAIEVEELQ